MLVYLPLLTLEGIEGKMFRPMAITMACALAGALIFSIVFFPALLAAFVPPPSNRGAEWLEAIERTYARWVVSAIAWRRASIACGAGLFVIAVVLALLLAFVTLQPWLSRYVPWRLSRVRRVRAAHQAIRTASDLSDPDTKRLLAMRAVTRLDYADLLEYTPDPLGDWEVGRHEALARAELASQGLDA
jgi:hypothetical protein